MKAPTLYDAIQGLLGPLMAEYGRLIDEGSDDAPVTIMIGNYKHQTTPLERRTETWLATSCSTKQ